MRAKLHLNFHPTKKGPGRRNYKTRSELLAIRADIILNRTRLPFYGFSGAKLLVKAAQKKLGLSRIG